MERRTASTPVRIAASALLGAATIIIVLTIRVVIESRDKLLAADALLEEGDTAAALDGYESSARAYAPGNPFAPAALRKMTLIAKAAKMRGEDELCLYAWETVRRSIISTRHVFQPNRDLLETAQDAILAQTAESSAKTQTPSRVALPEDPSTIASILLFAGLLLWIGGAAAVIVSRGTAPRPRRVAYWAFCLLGMITWITMSWLA